MTDEMKEAKEWYSQLARTKASQNGRSRWMYFEANGKEYCVEAVKVNGSITVAYTCK